MSERTPGPWTAYIDTGHSTQYRHEIVAWGKTIAHLYCTKGDEAQDASNAHLIAAAPELFAALEQFVIRERDWESDALDKARAALAKARGEQP